MFWIYTLAGQQGKKILKSFQSTFGLETLIKSTV